MQISVNTDLFKSIQWNTDDDKDLKKKLTDFSYQIGVWCSAINLAFSNPSVIGVVLNPPWTPFTSVVTSGAGSATSTSNSSFLRLGKTVFLNVNITITAVGTASGAMFVSVPVAPKRQMTWVCRETAVNGLIFSFTCSAASTTAQILTSANANPAWALYSFPFSVVYEIA